MLKILFILLMTIGIASFYHSSYAPVQYTVNHVPRENFATKGSGDRLVIYFHGAGETETALGDPQKLPIINKLIGDGYTVAASRAEGNNWGSARSVNDYVALYNYLNAEHHYKSVVFLAQSMGGLDSLQALDKIPASRWFGIYPLTNLSSSSPAIFATVGSSSLNIANRGYRATLGATHSYGDTVVPRKYNTDVLKQYNPDMTVITTVGDHGDASNFDTNTIVGFLEATS